MARKIIPLKREKHEPKLSRAEQSQRANRTILRRTLVLMVLFGVVGLACVTTAVALTSSAAAYFTELCRGKVSYKVFVIAICVFSAVVSNLGLDRIVAVAAPVLDVIYPPPRWC